MKKPFKILLVLLPLLFVVFLVLLINKVSVSTIYCANQYGECSTDLNRELSTQLGKNIFKARNEIEKILDSKVYVNNYSIYYEIPDILEVNVLVEKPKYAVHNGENFLLVGRGGVVLSLSEDSVLPSIYMKDKFLDVGDKVNRHELFSLKLIYDIQKMFSIENAKLKEGHLEVILEDGMRVLLPTSGDRKHLVGSLILIIDSLKDSDIRSKSDVNVQIIDLRFKNPILK